MKKIAIFGGTFNPVHLEHKMLCKSAIEELSLDKLIVVPTNIPPHKAGELASGEDRLNMLKLCFLDDEKVEVSDFELKNGGTSYTYITIEHFKNLYPDAELYFLMGGDMLKDFKTWKYPERILEKAKIAVFTRLDFTFNERDEREYFSKTFSSSFTLLSYSGKNLSSTRIRLYSALSLPLDGLVDNRAQEYIKEKNLYQGGRYFEFVKKTLPEKRLIHTAEVTVTALKKVKELNLDKNKVITACILHDAAKYIDHTTVKGFKLPDGVPNPVVHAFLGAYIAKNHLKIDDEEIIDAIRYHTSGKPEMSVLGKLLFTADMIEKNRIYDGVERLREIYEEDFDRCFIECLKEEMVHLLNKKSYIYEKTLLAYDYYVNKGE